MHRLRHIETLGPLLRQEAFTLQKFLNLLLNIDELVNINSLTP